MKKRFCFLVFLAAAVFSVAVFAAEQKVIVEAEKYVKEEGGSLKTADGRVDSSGNSCIMNWNDKGHVVEWNVEIPESGEYKMVFRYSGGRKWNIFREVKIDGKIPADAFKQVTFVPTGGFTKDTNFWKNFTVTDSKGNPVLVTLSKGKHLLRIANLGGDGQDGAANFDSIGFLSKDVDSNVLGKPGAK
jgi:hypothetical protein